MIWKNLNESFDIRSVILYVIVIHVLFCNSPCLNSSLRYHH